MIRVPLVVLAAFIASFVGWFLIQRSQTKFTVAVSPVPLAVAKPVADGEDRIPVVAANGPHPKVVVEERAYDFGTMDRRDIGSHSFRIKNVGEAPLEIVARRVDTSCDCTVGEVSRRDPIPPGEDATVELTWEPKSRIPRFRQTAKVRTNDPENTIIELTVTGVVDNPFHLVPDDVWYLGTVSSDQRASVAGVLFSRTQSDFEQPKFVCTNRSIDAEWQPMDAGMLHKYEAKSGYNLIVHADIADPTMRLSELVTLAMPEEKKPIAQFHLRGGSTKSFAVTGRGWEPQNAVLKLGEFAAAEGKAAELSYFIRSDRPVTLASWQCANDSVRVFWERDDSFQSASPTQRYRLKLEIMPGVAVNRQQDRAEEVELKFDHPDLARQSLHIDYISH